MAFGDKIQWSIKTAVEATEDAHKVAAIIFQPFEAQPLTRAEVEAIKIRLEQNTKWFDIQDVGLPFQEYVKQRKPVAVLAEIELPPTIMRAMPCFYCTKPVVPGLDLPVVIEWGKREPGQPMFVGTPYKTIAHQTCNNEARKRK